MNIESPWCDSIHFFKKVTSTNDLVLELAEAGAPEGTIVIAEEQTCGRGQFHRSWSSLLGKGLWMSLLLRLPIKNEMIRPLSQLGVVSLYDALLQLGIATSALHIKAPNDLLLDGKKVAGVLVETRRGTSPFAVVGIGLNIGHRLEDFPEALQATATSLFMHGMHHVNCEELTPIVIDTLYQRYQELHSNPAALHNCWSRLVE